MKLSFLPTQHTLLFSLHIVEVFPPPHLETLFLYLELFFSSSSTHLIAPPAPQNARFSPDFIQVRKPQEIGPEFFTSINWKSTPGVLNLRLKVLLLSLSPVKKKLYPKLCQ